ncbi:hypothetical protein [Neobacillus novalis]|uniref:hypothetical protein n=1 Tax=Neobacillus novalis TaxID=220687 RepID=UPI0008251051|nr:hypothetical protein [Neobacillus novalis]
MYIGIGLGRLKNEKKSTQEKLAEVSKLNTRYTQDLKTVSFLHFLEKENRRLLLKIAQLLLQ